MLRLTPQGLYCPTGNFYIDPSRGVDHAVVTHAHADHARRGSKQYYCAASGVGVLKQRLGQKINVVGIPFGQKFCINGVTVSLHPAGHILGSAQVRIEGDGEVWVASGDYKREPDPTCEPFEVVPCDVFITEATFGTPAYTWSRSKDQGHEIFEWWMANADRGVNSVLFAYSLGKAQRILGLLYPYAIKPVYCHSAVTPLNECYRSEGIDLAEAICLSTVDKTMRLKGELLLVPQAFLKSEQNQILGDHFETAFASGWMARQQFGYDKGFTISDHADWNDLVRTIQESQAKRVYVQHRGHGALVRHLRGLGLDAFPDTELKPLDPRQMELF